MLFIVVEIFLETFVVIYADRLLLLTDLPSVYAFVFAVFRCKTFTFSKSVMETSDQCVKPVQS